MRVLRLEVGRLEWLLGVTARLLPRLPAFRREIETLKAQVIIYRPRYIYIYIYIYIYLGH